MLSCVVSAISEAEAHSDSMLSLAYHSHPGLDFWGSSEGSSSSDHGSDLHVFGNDPSDSANVQESDASDLEFRRFGIT